MLRYLWLSLGGLLNLCNYYYATSQRKFDES
jgi:hypothetical protein